LETAKNNPNNQKPPQKHPKQKTNPNHTQNNQKPTTTTKQNPIFPSASPPLSISTQTNAATRHFFKQQKPNKHPPAQPNNVSPTAPKHKQQ
jgi:hypothetical protein